MDIPYNSIELLATKINLVRKFVASIFDLDTFPPGTKFLLKTGTIIEVRLPNKLYYLKGTNYLYGLGYTESSLDKFKKILRVGEYADDDDDDDTSSGDDFTKMEVYSNEITSVGRNDNGFNKFNPNTARDISMFNDSRFDELRKDLESEITTYKRPKRSGGSNEISPHESKMKRAKVNNKLAVLNIMKDLKEGDIVAKTYKSSNETLVGVSGSHHSNSLCFEISFEYKKIGDTKYPATVNLFSYVPEIPNDSGIILFEIGEITLKLSHKSRSQINYVDVVRNIFPAHSENYSLDCFSLRDRSGNYALAFYHDDNFLHVPITKNSHNIILTVKPKYFSGIIDKQYEYSNIAHYLPDSELKISEKSIMDDIERMFNLDVINLLPDKDKRKLEMLEGEIEELEREEDFEESEKKKWEYELERLNSIHDVLSNAKKVDKFDDRRHNVKKTRPAQPVVTTPHGQSRKARRSDSPVHLDDVFPTVLPPVSIVANAGNNEMDAINDMCIDCDYPPNASAPRSMNNNNIAQNQTVQNDSIILNGNVYNFSSPNPVGGTGDVFGGINDANTINAVPPEMNQAMIQNMTNMPTNMPMNVPEQLQFNMLNQLPFSPIPMNMQMGMPANAIIMPVPMNAYMNTPMNMPMNGQPAAMTNIGTRNNPIMIDSSQHGQSNPFGIPRQNIGFVRGARQVMPASQVQNASSIGRLFTNQQPPVNQAASQPAMGFEDIYQQSLRVNEYLRRRHNPF